MNSSNKNAAPASTSMQNLLETAASKGTYKTFGRVVEAAGLSETLAGEGPFTVFAPTDAAFSSLPAGKLEMLLKPENKPELISLLNYHVVTGRKTAAQIGKWDAARTVNGQSAAIKLVDNKVSIDGAQITAADIDAKNGYLHGIDKVNLPTPASASA
jgi:uncharacterized surface protein with fasciclin (FAS1) repeats